MPTFKKKSNATFWGIFKQWEDDLFTPLKKWLFKLLYIWALKGIKNALPNKLIVLLQPVCDDKSINLFMNKLIKDEKLGVVIFVQ